MLHIKKKPYLWNFGFFLQKGQFEQVGTWNEVNNPSLDLPIGKISWPGGSSQIPTDKGKPGKALFRIGFVSPINPSLDVLGEYGEELRSAFRVALDVINNGYYQVIIFYIQKYLHKNTILFWMVIAIKMFFCDKFVIHHLFLLKILK